MVVVVLVVDDGDAIYAGARTPLPFMSLSSSRGDCASMCCGAFLPHLNFKTEEDYPALSS